MERGVTLDGGGVDPAGEHAFGKVGGVSGYGLLRGVADGEDQARTRRMSLRPIQRLSAKHKSGAPAKERRPRQPQAVR